MQIARHSLALLCIGLVSLGLVQAQDQPAPTGEAQKEQPAQEKPTPLGQIGQPAPDFTLLDCTGKKHALADYKDKIVVLQWVNQECPWSVQAIPVIRDVQKKFEGKGIVWLGIDSTFGRTAEDDAKYVKDKELSYAILMDADGKVGRAYGVRTTPHVFVVNKGTLIYMGALHNNQQGDKKPTEVRNYLDEALGAALAGKDVPLSETTAWGCRVKYHDADRKGPKKAHGEHRRPEKDEH